MSTFTIHKQIINDIGRVIYLYGQENKTTRKGLIPVKPSSIIKGIEYTFYDDTSILDTYENTKQWLNRMSTLHSSLKCKPRFRVVEDGMIVGVLTESNLFVPISEPVVSHTFDDDLPVFKESNSIFVDNDIHMTKDTITNKYISNIEVESNFYSAFRNTIRNLLNLTKHKNVLRHIKKTIDMYDTAQSNDEDIDRKQYIKDIWQSLYNISSSYVSFTSITEETLQHIRENGYVGLCDNSTTCEINPFCISKRIVEEKSQEQCSIMIPDLNLVTRENNFQLYYTRLADELLRYSNVRSFFFEPKIFLSLGSTKYMVNDDEHIVTETQFIQEYIPSRKQSDIKLNKKLTTSKYFHKDTQEYGDPDIIRNAITYDTNIVLEDITVPKHHEKDVLSKTRSRLLNEGEEICIGGKRPVKGVRWGEVFKGGFSEYTYQTKDKRECGYPLLSAIYSSYFLVPSPSQDNIVRSMTTKIMEIISTPEHIINFTGLIKSFQVDLKKESALKLSKLEKIKDTLTQDELFTSIYNILNDSKYYITNTDIILFSEIYTIPIALVTSSKYLPQLQYAANVKDDNRRVWTNKPNSEMFVIIRQYGITPARPIAYTIISKDEEHDNNNSLAVLRKDLPDIILIKISNIKAAKYSLKQMFVDLSLN